MRFIDYLTFAFRNTRRQKLRSTLTVFAVIIGATSVTVMLALVTSAKTFLVHQYEQTGELTHVVVTQQPDLDYRNAVNQGGPSNEGTKLTAAMATTITSYPHVRAVARVVNPGAIAAVIYGNKQLSTQQVEGYDANGVIKHTLTAGRELRSTDGDGVVTITKDYAEKFGFGANPNGIVGRTIILRTRPDYSGVGATITPPAFNQGPNGNGGPGPEQQQQPTNLSAKVVGVVTTDSASYAVYVPMKWAEGMMVNRRYDMTPADRQAFDAAQQAQHNGRPGVQQPPPQPNFTLMTTSELDTRGYSSFVVQTDNVKYADAVAKHIKTLGVGAATAQSMVQEQLTIFNIIGAVLGGIGAIALVVATIGVVNTMVMAVLERTREIGVMRACGATRRAVRRLFTSEAAFLGFLGGVGGVAIAFGLALIANVVINKQLASNGIRSSNIIGVPAWLAIAVMGGTTIIGVLAGLGPAARAARLNPVDALRYE